MVLAFPTKMVLAFPLHPPPPKKPKYCFNEYKTIQSENTVGASFHTAENIINNLNGTVDSLYLELARDQQICSRERKLP